MKEIILRENGSVYKEVDYIQHLEFRLEYILNKKEDLYWKNEHGGMNLIDEYGCSDYHPFSESNKLLTKIIKAQMDKRIKNNQK